MAANSAHNEEATNYDDSVDYSWTERAFEMMGSDSLHGEVFSQEDVVSSHVWGKCPRCGHALDDRQTHTAVTNLMSAPRRSGTTKRGLGDEAAVRYFDVDVSCHCEDDHAGAPVGTAGCGVSFRVELPVQTAAGQP